MDAEVIARVAERKIQEATEEGKFDNLPGKGKPIVFEEDASVPLHVRLANQVLKNAGALPDWIQVQKDIQNARQEATKLRTRLIRENQLRRPAALDLPAYHPKAKEFAAWYAKSRASYLKALKQVNSDLLKLSLMAPPSVQTPNPYRIELEMSAFDADFPPLPQCASEEVSAEPTPEPGQLKKLARERYAMGQSGAIGGWLKTARTLGQSEPGSSALGRDDEDVRLKPSE